MVIVILQSVFINIGYSIVFIIFIDLIIIINNNDEEMENNEIL